VFVCVYEGIVCPRMCDGLVCVCVRVCSDLCLFSFSSQFLESFFGCINLALKALLFPRKPDTHTHTHTHTHGLRD
jgi:hypothetical protein